MDDNLDDGHQTDQGLLCDTLPSPAQSAQIFCRKHRDETHIDGQRESDIKLCLSNAIKQRTLRSKLLKKQITANFVRMDTSCSVVPCCASSHSSSRVARSALASTAMATAMAADTAADKADDRTADTAAGGSSSGDDIAAWKTERGVEAEEKKRRDK